jgi:hypothetical protein
MNDLHGLFADPPKRYRPYPIVHNWPGHDRTTLMDAIAAYGFGGVVTNVPFKDGFTQNPANLAEFPKILAELEARGLAYWLYDENGYPSGYVGGATLEGHPELAARGFYMRRRAAYEEPMHIRFRTEDPGDEIIWAAKYPIKVTPRKDDCHPDLTRMTPVPFGHDELECDLGTFETLYVFATHPAHEGSQATHNTWSFKPYINILDPRAVRRFIELVFEPMEKAAPGCISRAEAVFTDEPSLMTTCARGYETWPWALLPWKDGLLDDFEAEYGFDLRPRLPLLFDGGYAYAPVRVRFFELIGKLAARAYSGALRDWCAAHGGLFSGHYLAEETQLDHIAAYGSFTEVLRATGRPGLDVLACVPERFSIRTVKYPQMVARKRGGIGMMVEICPFSCLDEFNKAPVDNMVGVMNLLYLSGVCYTNSYFGTDFSDFAPGKIDKPASTAASHRMKRDEARFFAAYVGRLGLVLDGARNECGVFVYSAPEDAEARYHPANSSIWKDKFLGQTDSSIQVLTDALFQKAVDFSFIDAEDVADAAKNPSAPAIFGTRVRAIVVPALNWMKRETWNGLRALAAAGTKILFVDNYPRYSTDLAPLDAWDGVPLGEATEFAKPTAVDQVVADLDALPGDPFRAEADGLFYQAHYTAPDGREIRMLASGSRQPIEVSVSHASRASFTLFDVETGVATAATLPATVKLPPLRAAFLVIEAPPPHRMVSSS